VRLETFGADVEATLADPTVTFRYHADAMNEHDKLRRVVWIGTGGVVDEARPGRAGQVKVGQVSGTVAPYDRAENVEIHVYADTDDNLETLVENLIIALNMTLARCRPTYAWVNQTPAATGRALRSKKCVLKFVLHMPIREELSALTAITGDQIQQQITS